MTDEAKLIQQGGGLKPEGDGWFVVNLTETSWRESDEFGRWATFEGDQRFGDMGLNVHVLAPGQAACMYHREGLQEGFLVLQGEALAVVNGEERPLARWDYFHCPPGTEHVLVGAGDGPCVLLMLGARGPDHGLFYPVNEAAERHGASTKEGTALPKEAYAHIGETRDIPSPWPIGD